MPFSFRRRRKDESSHHHHHNNNNNEEDDSSNNVRHQHVVIPLHDDGETNHHNHLSNSSTSSKSISNGITGTQLSHPTTTLTLLPTSSSSSSPPTSSSPAVSASGIFQHVPLSRQGSNGKASSFLSWLGYHMMKKKTGGNSPPSSSTSSSLSSSAQSIINVSSNSIHFESHMDDHRHHTSNNNHTGSSELLTAVMNGDHEDVNIHSTSKQKQPQQGDGVHRLLLSVTNPSSSDSQGHYTIVDQHQNPQQYHQLHSLLKKRNHHLKLSGNHLEESTNTLGFFQAEEKNLSPKNLSSSEENTITSPRVVISTPTGTDKVLSTDEFYRGFVDDIISDSDHSDVMCFSPPAADDMILHEAHMLSNAHNEILPTSLTTTTTEEQLELDPDMLEFEEWFKKFEIGADNEGNGTVDLNATVKKKSRAKSFSKFVTAMSEPFVHTGSSAKTKVKTLSPKSFNNNDQEFKTSDDTSATGGALIINDNENEQNDKGRFSRSFKNLVLLARKHPSSPPHTASSDKQAQAIIQNSVFLTCLPQEIKHYVFQFLEFKFILSLRLVCKEFKDIADDNTFWETLCTELSLDFSMVSYKHLKQLYIENQGMFESTIWSGYNVISVFVTVVGTEEVGKSLLIKRCSNNPALLLESFVVGPRRLYDSFHMHDEEPYYIYFREINKENKSLLKSHSIKEDMFFVCFSIFDKKSFCKTKKVSDLCRTLSPFIAISTTMQT